MKLENIALYEGPLPQAIAPHAQYVDVLTAEGNAVIESGMTVRDPNNGTPLSENEKNALYHKIYDPINENLLRQANDLNKQRGKQGLAPIRIIADWRTNRYHLTKEMVRSAEEGEPHHELRLNAVVQAVAYTLPLETARKEPGFVANGRD